MRAVAIASDRSLQVVDIDRPVPGAGEVLLDVSFCGTDGALRGVLGPDRAIVGLPVDPVPLSLDWVVVKEIVIRGSLTYTDRDFAEAMEHIAAGRIPCGQVATTKAPLEHAPRWFADLGSGATQQVKVLLSPRPGGPSSAGA